QRFHGSPEPVARGGDGVQIDGLESPALQQVNTTKRFFGDIVVQPGWNLVPGVVQSQKVQSESHGDTDPRWHSGPERREARGNVGGFLFPSWRIQVHCRHRPSSGPVTRPARSAKTGRPDLPPPPRERD